MVFNDTDGLYTYTFEAEKKVTVICCKYDYDFVQLNLKPVGPEFQPGLYLIVLVFHPVAKWV